jgi:translocation and assembly module TamB
VALDADGWPARVDLTGRIGAAGGGPVLLAIPGPQTRVAAVDLGVQYDARASDLWTIDATALGLRREGFAMERARLAGSGRLTPDLRSLSGAFELALSGLAQDDPGLDAALGDALRGRVTLAWDQGAPLRLSQMDLSGADYRLTGAAEITGIEGQLGLAAELDARLEADQLARFGALTGSALQGAAALDLAGRVAPVSGAFDLTLNGTGADLAIGQPQIDTLIGGATTLAISAQRDETGVTLRALDIRSGAAEITAGGRLASEASALRFEAGLRDVGIVAPGVIGPARVTGRARQSGQSWTLTTQLSAPGGLGGNVEADIAMQSGAPARVEGSAQLSVTALSDYAALLDLPLTGAASFTANGRWDPPAERFTLELDGRGTDLALGQPQLDALTQGTTQLRLAASGAADVVTLSAFELRGAGADLTAEGAWTPEASQLRYTAALRDLGRVVPELDGPAEAVGTAVQSGALWQLGADLTAPGAARGRLDATLRLSEGAPGTLEGAVQLGVDDLTAYAALLGQPLGGGARLDARGAGDLRDLSFEVTAEATGRNLRIGQPEADRLLRGESRLDVRVQRAESGVITLAQLDLQTPALRADVTGRHSGAETALRYALRLNNLGLFVPDIPGPVSGEGTLEATGGPYRVALALQGPGGVNAQLGGTLARDMTEAALQINGAAPLGLANRRIAPNLLAGTARFDLGLSGGFDLSALSGTIRAEGARATVPALALSLTDIAATARIAGGTADLSATAGVSTGGQLSMRGRSGLAAPYPAGLSVTLSNIGVRDPKLYETTLGGSIGLRGALARGAAITGALALGPTEIRIPDGAGAASGAVPRLVHLNEPAAVRQTRARGADRDGARRQRGRRRRGLSAGRDHLGARADLHPGPRAGCRAGRGAAAAGHHRRCGHRRAV